VTAGNGISLIYVTTGEKTVAIGEFLYLIQVREKQNKATPRPSVNEMSQNILDTLAKEND